MTALASYSHPFCPGSYRYEGRGGREGEEAGGQEQTERFVSPQVLAGIYPIAQIQEPYTAVGYLASRIPVQVLLRLRHPEAKDPSAEHPWCAWDICEGGLHVPGFPSPYPEPCLSPHLSSEVLPLVKHLATHAWISVVGPARSVAWDVLEKTGRAVLWEWGGGDWAQLMASLPTIVFSLSSLGREAWL